MTFLKSNEIFMVRRMMEIVWKVRFAISSEVLRLVSFQWVTEIDQPEVCLLPDVTSLSFLSSSPPQRYVM
jgi:hypothetical protein